MKQILIAVFALAVGGVGGYFIAQPKANPPSQQEVEIKTPDKRDATIKKLTTEIKNLKDDIVALKDKLAKAKKSALATEQKVAVTLPTNAVSGVTISGISPEEAEKMRPKVMSLITNMFAKASSKRQNAMQAKLDILASVDTSKLTPAQRKTHERYQQLLAKQAKLREKFMGTITGAITGGKSTTKMDGESMLEMMAVDKEVTKLAAEERSNLLTQMVQTIGLTGNEATETTEALGAIYTATESTKGGGLGSLGDALSNIGGAIGGGEADGSDEDVKAETKVITIGM